MSAASAAAEAPAEELGSPPREAVDGSRPTAIEAAKTAGPSAPSAGDASSVRSRWTGAPALPCIRDPVGKRPTKPSTSSQTGTRARNRGRSVVVGGGRRSSGSGRTKSAATATSAVASRNTTGGPAPAARSSPVAMLAPATAAEKQA